MSDSKSVKMHYDVAGDDFDRAGEASAGLKRLLQKIGVPADIIRRIAIGTYEAEMNVIIHAGGNTALAVALHGIGGHGNYGNSRIENLAAP